MSIEDIVKLTRKTFSIETPFNNKSSYKNYAFNYFRNKLENKGILVLQIDGIEVSEIRGLSLDYEIVPIIAVNRKDADRAKVFTMFHELAHLIRRTSNLCQVDFKNNDFEEKKCNDIAANILIPDYTIDDEINNKNLNDDMVIEKLSDKYAVSKFVIIKRLYELNKISIQQYKEKYDEYLDNFNSIKEKRKKIDNKSIIIPPDKKLISKTGKLYPKVVLNAYYDGKISLGETCNILNVSTRYIDSLGRMVMNNE